MNFLTFCITMYILLNETVRKLVTRQLNLSFLTISAQTVIFSQENVLADLKVSLGICKNFWEMVSLFMDRGKLTALT